MKPDTSTACALERIRDESATWDELTTFARSAHKGVSGAALMRIARSFRDDRAVHFLEQMATGPERHRVLMATATVGDVCLLLLREMGTASAAAAYRRIYDASPGADRDRMSAVLKNGL